MNEHTPSNGNKSFSRLVFVITAITVAADQLSKHLVLRHFSPGGVEHVIPGFFNLTLAYNPGAAFGLWTGFGEPMRSIVLAATILLALTAVIFFLRHPSYRTAWAQSALAMIMGGAIGNVIDRFVHGSVVDFLDFYIGNSHWPAFNVADSAICVGVGAVLLIRPAEKDTTAASSAA